MIERTVLEHRQQRFWAGRREKASNPRKQLRESDLLMAFLEECRLHQLRLVPAGGWRRMVFFVAGVDSSLSRALGIDRGIDHVSGILFRTQRLLMQRNVELRRPRLARIIPLFAR